MSDVKTTSRSRVDDDSHNRDGAMWNVSPKALIATGMAYELGEKCDGVSARLLRGLNFCTRFRVAFGTYGYSTLKSTPSLMTRAEKDRLEAIARALNAVGCSH
jgi:hypothetical protein